MWSGKALVVRWSEWEEPAVVAAGGASGMGGSGGSLVEIPGGMTKALIQG